MSRNKSVAILTMVFLAACGDNGSDNGGQALTAVTRGAVTGTSNGAIVVNGVNVSTSGATIRVEDSAGTVTDLREGMVVTVKGSFDDRSGGATEIEYEHAVKGRVTSVDPATGNVSVGGQTVRVDDTTEFGEDNPARLGSVAVGDRVRVSGVPDDKGGIRASRVDDSPTGDNDLELKGFVSNLTATGFTFKVTPDAATSYTVTLGPGAVIPAGVQNGSYVEVRSLGPVNAGAIVAASISLEDRFGARRVNVEVEGIVSSGDSNQFVVDGTTVQTSGSTRWQFGVPADLLPGVKVEAEGHLDDAGVIQATKVSYRAVIRLEGPIANLSISGNFGTFQLLGFTISISDLTDERIAVANGQTVEVRGYPDHSGANIVATRIDEGNGNGRIFIQGVASAKDEAAGTVVVLGVTVQTSAGTSYHDSRGTSGSGNDVIISKSDFFGAIDAGRTIVKARGSGPGALSGSVLAAEEAELEGDE